MIIVLCAVGSPAAVFLVAGCDSGLKAGGVPLCYLDRPYHVGFFHFPGLNTHVLGDCLNLFNSHCRDPLKYLHLIENGSI